jgi:hypothetical protein
MPVSDERDGEPQPGDTVIELNDDGVPVVYTEPMSDEQYQLLLNFRLAAKKGYAAGVVPRQAVSLAQKLVREARKLRKSG